MTSEQEQEKGEEVEEDRKEEEDLEQDLNHGGQDLKPRDQELEQKETSFGAATSGQTEMAISDHVRFWEGIYLCMILTKYSMTCSYGHCVH